MIFDCHTHRFSAGELLETRDAGAWLVGFDASGITHGVVLPYVGLCDARLISKENDAIARSCACRPGRLVPFFTVNLQDSAAAETEFTRCVGQLGCGGVKIHPWLQATSVNSPAVDTVCELAGKGNLPVLFHDGTPCFSLPSQVAMLARRHPNTRFILGHSGLLDYWCESIDALNSAENLWACLCGPDLHGLRELLRRCDQERLVWGSDYGFVSTAAVRYRLDLLREAAGDDGVFERIVAVNSLRLFSMDASEAIAAVERDGDGQSVPRRPAPPPKWLAGDGQARKAREPDPVVHEGE